MESDLLPELLIARKNVTEHKPQKSTWLLCIAANKKLIHTCGQKHTSAPRLRMWKSRRRVCKTPKQTQISRIETAYEYYCGCMEIQNLLLFGAELLFRKHQDGVSPGVWKASRCSECDFKTMWLCCAIDDHVLGERKVEVVKQRGTTTHISPDVHDLSKWWNNPGQLFTRALRVQSDWCRQRKRDTR